MTLRKRAGRIAKRLHFALGQRPVLRSGVNWRHFVPYILWKTPKVKGKRLVLKSPLGHAGEKRGRQLMEQFHQHEAGAQNYTFELSKRFPAIRGKRTEIYYDRPTLGDLMERRWNRRVRKFLRENQVTMAQAHVQAVKAFLELNSRIEDMEWAHDVDFHAEQLMVNSMPKDRKLRLILIDI